MRLHTMVGIRTWRGYLKITVLISQKSFTQVRVLFFAAKKLSHHVHAVLNLEAGYLMLPVLYMSLLV